jgi:transcriptional regulator with XRE-family HTH domain
VTRSVFSPAYQRLRETLVAARRSRQLTQADLGRALGRPQSFVSKYERGERRLDLVEVVEIAEALRIDPCDLVTDVKSALRLGTSLT